MLTAAAFAKLRKEYAAYEAARREVVKEAGDALSLSKQAIFAFHRDDLAGGGRTLDSARAILDRLGKRFQKIPGLVWEGSYRAALEEFAEASLVGAFLARKRLARVEAPGMDADALLGGALDFTGELVRRAVTAVTRGDAKEAHRCHEAAGAVMSELVRMNITGPLRPKYDQARTNLRKLEEILYDLSLRGR